MYIFIINVTKVSVIKWYYFITSSLVFNDGTKQNLVQFEGTIPVPYKGKFECEYKVLHKMQIMLTVSFRLK